jgi:DNA (cytosine-5)-methyltransferase 1
MSAVADSPRSETAPEALKPLSVAGLFAGIGGIELGLHRAGHDTLLLCEVDDAAKRVLKTRFSEIELVGDVRSIKGLPKVDLVAAGFPCQDLSQAGRTAGIEGAQSGLVGEVFRLLNDESRSPTWLLLENVPFMLQLDRGNAMRFLVDSLEAMGFTWAYRVVDTRSFGLPQRRHRVILLASRSEDARQILFHGDQGEPAAPHHCDLACGFYWTEGIRGLGWAVDGVPTLKGGSTIGIPSPPAIWMPDGTIGTPDIRDAERLQGFDPDWTAPAAREGARGEGQRWKLVGNAVSVPVSEWVGHRLRNPQPHDESPDEELPEQSPWPIAAWGNATGRYRVHVSRWPVDAPSEHLEDFLRFPLKPLSERATAGFLRRTSESTLRFPGGLLDAVDAHLRAVREAAAA